MSLSRLRHLGVAAALALFVLAFTAPGAMAKQAPLEGQLIGDAAKAGSNVVAPVLLTEKSAKKLKLRSPLANLSLKASKGVPVPNPTGQGTVTVAADTLRSGDRINGKGKLKGSAKKLMPVVKAGALSVSDRESAYSVDEVTSALVTLFQRVALLELRVDNLESSLNDQIAVLRAEIEKLKQQDSSLQGQINSLLGDLTALETELNGLIADLDALTSTVGGLPTAADLTAIQDQIDDLEAALSSGLAGLQTQVDALPTNDEMTMAITSAINALDADLQGQISTLDSTVDGLAAEVALLCGLVPLAGC